MKDPVRLLSGGSPDVQDVLRSAKGDAPMRAQLDHLASRLAPTVAAPASAALLPWLIAGAALVGAAGAFMLARPTSQQPAAVRTEAPPPRQPEAAVPAVAVGSNDPVTEPARAATKKPQEPPRLAVAAEPARQAPPLPPVPRELELLTPAQAALHASDFARALALADRHARLYATGTFAEEREAIAIEALQRLGQRDRARTRLTAFTTQYPHSGYRARLERMVGE